MVQQASSSDVDNVALRSCFERGIPCCKTVNDRVRTTTIDLRQYSKNGVTCVLSSLDGDAIVLPPSAIPWLISQPDTAISTDESTKHVLQTKYSFTVPEIMDRTIHFGRRPFPS